MNGHVSLLAQTQWVLDPALSFLSHFFEWFLQKYTIDYLHFWLASDRQLFFYWKNSLWIAWEKARQNGKQLHSHNFFLKCFFILWSSVRMDQKRTNFFHSNFQNKQILSLPWSFWKICFSVADDIHITRCFFYL